MINGPGTQKKVYSTEDGLHTLAEREREDTSCCLKTLTETTKIAQEHSGGGGGGGGGWGARELSYEFKSNQ
jgi:hypothetical protein